MGTGRGALTAADGRYRLRGLRGGPATVRVARLGFTVATQAVNVPDSGTVTADFTLTPAATTLSQVVVSAPAESQQARENGNTITTIAVDSIPKAPLINFSDVLQARAPRRVTRPPYSQPPYNVQISDVFPTGPGYFGIYELPVPANVSQNPLYHPCSTGQP